jgi:hypothetical protein
MVKLGTFSCDRYSTSIPLRANVTALDAEKMQSNTARVRRNDLIYRKIEGTQ